MMQSVAQSFAEPVMPAGFFQFSGQSVLDAWTLKDVFQEKGWCRYDAFLKHEPVLCFQRIRELVDEFPTWRHRAKTGRKPIKERDILIALLVRQILRAPYRQLHGFLHMLKDFFGMETIPGASTISEKNRTWRFHRLLKRFHRFVLESLPSATIIVATDATGYGRFKQSWRETDYGLRATQDWCKSHDQIAVPQLLYLGGETTAGGIHESQLFDELWDGLPRNLEVPRSLADSAYSGNANLESALTRGATPIHDIKSNARHHAHPSTAYEKLVNFATHWPNRYRQLKRLRVLAEATFSSTKTRLDDRIRCRDPIARQNEVQAKKTTHNIRILAMRSFVGGP